MIWLDPTPTPAPVAATGTGPHITLGACPGSDRTFQEVSNPGLAILNRQLLPEGGPDAAAVCLYDGLNGRPFQLREHLLLSAGAAQGLATAASQISLSHPVGGLWSCPADDGSAVVVVLAYPNLGDVDLIGALGGCPTISNGHILVQGALGYLARVQG